MPFPGFYLIWFSLLSLNPGPAAEFAGADLEVHQAPFTSITPTHIDSIYFDQYPFLKLESNLIINAQHLSPFFDKLKQLERGEIQRVNIVHIGDSHVQANWWTEVIRTYLQQYFGSGGRGLVFPYRLAQTNSPTDLHAGSNQFWEYRRSVFKDRHIPLGISGLTIQTRGSHVWLDLQVQNDTIINYAFDKITVFGDSCPDCLNWQIGQFRKTENIPAVSPPKIYHTVKAGDTLYGLALRYGTGVSRIQQWNNLRGSMIKPGQKLVIGNGNSSSTLYDQQPFETTHTLNWENSIIRPEKGTAYLDGLTHRLIMQGKRNNGSVGQARIYGISLENSKARGLVYHAIGVNGATFYHYNEASGFWEQLPDLLPDLVIVSLGTNEAAHSGFEQKDFSNEVDRFMSRLKSRIAPCPVLITTLPDALRRRRYDNPSIQIARETLLQSAEANNFGIWDLHEIMGGAGAIRIWRNHQLAARDYMHFSKNGYDLMGKLLICALMETYEKR